MADFDPTKNEALTVTGQPTRAPQIRQIAPNVEQIDFSDESIKQYEFELYSGKSNQTDRIYIPWAAGVMKTRTHFVERGTTKFSVVCRSQYVRRPDGSGEDLVQEAACCKVLGSSAPRFATLIVQYATDRMGQVTLPFTYFKKLWKFGSDKYQQIRNIGRDFPLEQHDLSVFCQPDGETYQKLQIGAKPDCYVMHPKFPEVERKTITDWAHANFNKLQREMGRTYPNDSELMKDLQQAGVLVAPGPVPTMVTDQPVANFEDVISQGVVQK